MKIRVSINKGLDNDTRRIYETVSGISSELSF
jgi:hypothetical protein